MTIELTLPGFALAILTLTMLLALVKRLRDDFYDF